jgi:hypothetical protein
MNSRSILVNDDPVYTQADHTRAADDAEAEALHLTAQPRTTPAGSTACETARR